MKWVAAGVAMTTIFIMTTQGEAYDGNALVRFCENGEAVFGGYISGVIDADHHNGEKPLYCIPDKVTGGQAYAVFCKYLQENPSRRHESGAWLVRRALVKAWPCSEKGDRQ